MYLPDVYKTTNREKIKTFIENNSFGDLVTVNNQSICSNKVPFYFDSDEHALYGHFGRSNPQLVDIKSKNEVLAIFSGPQSYISPRWYESENMVPTWNYQTLQVRGSAKIVDDLDLIALLEKLTAFHESRCSGDWQMKSVEPEKQKLLLSMIVGFRIDIREMAFKEKMSQTRHLKDQLGVIKGLNTANDEDALAVAQIMQLNLEV